MIYIDAEQLQDGLYNIKDGKIYKYKAKGGTARAYKLENRPQGEWIEQDDCWQCSNCGDEFVLEVDVKPIDAKMHYCPNCGARMFAKDTNVPNKKGADDE